MKPQFALIIFVLVPIAGLAVTEPTKPKIIFALADDLAYGDLGIQ